MWFGRIRAGVLASALGLAAACGDGNMLGPDNQIQVGNVPDNFQLQASNIVDVSQTLTYTWQNSGTGANVNKSGSVTAGSAMLTLLDDAGTQVYQGSLAETGTFQTTAGVAGDWTIRVELSGMSGTLNFRVQKP